MSTFHPFLLLRFLHLYLPILYFLNFQLKYLISSFLTEYLSVFFHRILLPEYQPTFYSWKLPIRNTFLLPFIENFLPGYLPTSTIKTSYRNNQPRSTCWKLLWGTSTQFLLYKLPSGIPTDCFPMENFLENVFTYFSLLKKTTYWNTHFLMLKMSGLAALNSIPYKIRPVRFNNTVDLVFKKNFKCDECQFSLVCLSLVFCPPLITFNL